MNRRTMLLGTGTVLATTVAGCGGSEADGEGDNEPDTPDEPDDALEEEDDMAVDDELSEEIGEDEEDDDLVESEDQIPGFEAEEFAVDSDELTVEEVTRDGETVTVLAEADTLDQDVLEDELLEGGRAFIDAIEDTEEFTEAVSTAEWDVRFGGSELAEFYIESAWIAAHEDGELSEAELLDRVLETVSMV